MIKFVVCLLVVGLIAVVLPADITIESLLSNSYTVIGLFIIAIALGLALVTSKRG